MVVNSTIMTVLIIKQSLIHEWVIPRVRLPLSRLNLLIIKLMNEFEKMVMVTLRFLL